MTPSADVVIIGGGCMGASVAYHLARRGMTDVVLVERERMLGTGSTGRNAGGVRHQFSNPANIRLSIESIRLLERFEDEVGHPIDFRQDGYLFLLSTPASVEAFRQTSRCSAARHRRGLARCSGAAATCTRARTWTASSAATFCARDGIADPNGVTMGFAKAAQARGVDDRARDGGDWHTVESGRVAGRRDYARHDRHADRRERRGPACARDRRMAGVDVPVEPYRRHIFIAAAAAAASAAVARAVVPDHGDRLRHDVLLSPRGRRAALRHG